MKVAEENNDAQSISDQEPFTVELKEKLQRIPTNPGIYQFKNTSDKIIYIGKARNLRNRVRSYFQVARYVDAKTKAMVSHINDLEIIVTDSEAEALILEDTLIKKFKPKYNILLRDDKSYPYVRVTNEPYPRVFVTRKIIRDGSKYFGPFTELKHLKRLMRVLRTLFLLRSCDHNINDTTIANKKYKLCLDYHIKKCEGPCQGLISREEYNENVRHSIQILNGKTKDIEKKLEEKMESLSDELRFEEAAIVRNRYLILKEYLSQQKIVTTELIDRDVFGFSRIESTACTLIFKVRDGKLTGKRHFIVINTREQNDSQILQTALEQWYLESEFIPKEILLPFEPEQTEFISDWLKKQRGKSLEINVPKLGDKKKIVNLACSNAEYILRDYHLSLAKREQTVPRAVLSLQRDLRLAKPPLKIECFDNSHIQGSELVSSLVVFIEGKPKK